MPYTAKNSHNYNPIQIPLLTYLLVFLSLFSFSQERKWEENLSHLDQLYKAREFKEMLEVADSLYTTAESWKQKEYSIQLNVFRGIGNHLMSTDYELAVACLNESVENLPLIPSGYHPDIYAYLGSAYLRAGSYRKGLVETQYSLPDSLTRLSLSIFRDKSNVEGEIRALKEVATVEIYKGNFENALELLAMSYEKAMEMDHPITRSLVNTIGIVYSIGKRQEEAIEFIERYYAFIGEGDLMWRDSYCFQLLAGAYHNMGNWEESKKNYIKAIELIDGKNGQEVRVWSYWPLAQACINLGQYEEANYWVAEAESYYELVKDPQMNSYMSLIRAQISIEKGAYTQAENYMNEYFRTASEMSVQNRFYQNSEVRYKLYKAWGKPELALIHLEKFHHLSDSVKEQDFSRQFEDYKVQLETAKQRVEILELENQLQARNGRIVLIISVSVFLLLAALWIIKRHQTEREKTQEQLSKKERELADSTLSLVRKDQVMQEINTLVNDTFRKSNGDLLHSIQQMKKLLHINRNQEENWSQFLEHFGAVHHDFFTKIKKRYTNLSPKDLKHCALLKMNLSLKESADILGVESNSVKVARYRLRKKMNVDEPSELSQILMNLN